MNRRALFLDASTRQGGGLGPQRPTLPRAPLGPWPSGSYDRTLPVPVPLGRDLHYYRGQFCGLRVPGAPIVPGCNGSNPELVMACLLDNYPADVQEQFLARYASYGYTHLQRSIGHALYYGSSLGQYIALSAKARRDYGLYCDHWLLNGGEGTSWMFKTPNQDGAFWKPFLQPYVSQLLAAGVVDTACVGWQLDQMQQSAPGNPTISLIAAVAQLLPPSVPVFTHWVNDAMAWWKTGGETWVDEYQEIFVHDRFTFWRAMAPYLTGGHYQGNTTLARQYPEIYQGRIRDTLNNFVNGRMGLSERDGVPKPFAMTNFECTAQDQFDGSCSEQEGDTIGYILTCTKADGYVAGLQGYGNGARLPDGSPL